MEWPDVKVIKNSIIHSAFLTNQDRLTSMEGIKSILLYSLDF